MVTSQSLRNVSQPRVATISRQEQAAAGGQDSVTLPRSPDTFDGLFVNRATAPRNPRRSARPLPWTSAARSAAEGDGA